MIDVAALQKVYEESGAWGMVASIDVHACVPEKLRDAASIQALIDGLVHTAEMVKHGPSYIERFGDETKHPGPGYSAMQFIETSSITIHCDEPKNRVFIDLFSCKFFNPVVLAEFAKEYFGAADYTLSVVVRK